MKLSSPPDCPYYLVSRATLAITSQLRRCLSEKGAGPVKPAYLGVLFCLWEEDGLQASVLGKRAGLEPSTMTGLLDRMERDGLVARQPDPRDRRASRICLTRPGREAREEARAAVSDALDKSFRGISGEDIKRLKRILKTVLANCSKEG